MNELIATSIEEEGRLRQDILPSVHFLYHRIVKDPIAIT